MVKRWLGWDQLNTKTLEDGSSAADITLQTKDVHLQESNKEVLKDVVLVNEATMRQDAAAIPGTLVIRQVISSDSGTKYPLDWIQSGEVWQVYGFCITAVTGRSGSCTHEVYIFDKNNSLRCEIIDFAASSSVFPLHENNWMGPVWMDENSRIDYECTGTFDASTLQFVSIRIR
tara:strand:- start:2387 stop:2908 length:522 start_codon:yes stop_codon:yes gene_type:complete